MNSSTKKALLLGALLAAFASPSNAQNRSWSEPFPAFKIVGNLYYVGTRGLASYLVASPRGHALINPNLEENVAQLQRSVESLGFRFSDIRVLLISHAHWDHVAATALVKRLTGASFMVMKGDAHVMASGGKTDFHYGTDATAQFPAVSADRELEDGDSVSIGDNVLVARRTPGHTQGCTTWTISVRDGDRTYNVVIVGSPNVNPGYRLVGNTSYPRITSDFEQTFRVLRALKADVFLGAHGSYFDLDAKYARLRRGDRNPFVDPDGYARFIADRERVFVSARQGQQARPSSRRSRTSGVLNA